MAVIDIVKGDYLIIGINQYAIKEVEWWDMEDANHPSFQKIATINCSTKRLAFINNKRESVDTASVNLSGLKCSPFDVISADLAMRLDLSTLHTLRQTQLANDTGYRILVLEVNE